MNVRRTTGTPPYPSRIPWDLPPPPRTPLIKTMFAGVETYVYMGVWKLMFAGVETYVNMGVWKRMYIWVGGKRMSMGVWKLMFMGVETYILGLWKLVISHGGKL